MKPMGVIPSLITLGNAVCGFSAIYTAARGDFLQASWLIILAMVFDALDGKVARLTKQTSDFGQQLDSLSDAVSFGIAPAVLVALMNREYFAPGVWSKAIWFFTLVFALCAILRLARYNVEGKKGSDQMTFFRGLPSPAAAGMIASLVVISFYVMDKREGLGAALLTPERATQLSLAITRFLVPGAALMLGYLMVSSLRYAHVFNRYFSGKRTFDYFAHLVLIVFVAAAFREIAIVVGFFAYVVSGPIILLVKEVRQRRVALDVLPAESTKPSPKGTRSPP